MSRLLKTRDGDCNCKECLYLDLDRALGWWIAPSLRHLLVLFIILCLAALLILMLWGPPI